MKHYNFDAHGMTVMQINNYLTRLLSFIPNGVFDICVIHGYNNGTKLRDYLRNSFLHQRVIQIDEFGEGRTLLILNKTAINVLKHQKTDVTNHSS